MNQPMAALFWIAVVIAAISAFAINPDLFSEREVFGALAVCLVGWLLIRGRRGQALNLGKIKARYRNSNEKSKLVIGLILLLASFAWVVVALPRISDTWGQVILVGFGPAVLLLVIGSVVFWLGIYRVFLRNSGS
jgi:hypothetical protein